MRFLGVEMNKNLFDFDGVVEIEIELTGVCNLKCPLCSRNYSYINLLKKKNIRDIDDIINQLEGFPNLELLYIAGTTSEPTMYKNFMELCVWAKQKEIKIELFTNGNTHDKKWWKKLSGVLHKDDEVYFTICGGTQEMHEIYRVGSNLSEIIANASAFRSDKRNDILQFIELEYNRREPTTEAFEDILALFSKLWVVKSDSVRSDKNYAEAIPGGVAPINERAKLLNGVLKNFPEKEKAVINALCLRQGSIFISQYGDIYGCYNYAKEVFDEPLEINNNKINFTPINTCANEVCKRCDERIINLTHKLDLEYIY